jgi:hypothetical protein
VSYFYVRKRPIFVPTKINIMLSIIIGILMSLGVINTGVEFNNLTSEQQELLINAWVPDEPEGY